MAPSAGPGAAPSPRRPWRFVLSIVGIVLVSGVVGATLAYLDDRGRRDEPATGPYAEGACEALARFEARGVSWSDGSWQEDFFPAYFLWYAPVGYALAAAEHDPELASAGEVSELVGEDGAPAGQPSGSIDPEPLAAAEERLRGVCVARGLPATDLGGGAGEAGELARAACRARQDWDPGSESSGAAVGLAVYGYATAAGTVDPAYAEFRDLGGRVHAAVSRFDRAATEAAAADLDQECAARGF